jgi:3-hydroxymyristoyl/3-hydroxydecanoyl-(acyl carrier protein) dehydratase
VSDSESRIEISEEEVGIICRPGSGISVIPSGSFRLFDKVDEVIKPAEAGALGFIRTKGNLARAHDIFTHHFLGRPIIPGMILMDQFFQLAGLYAAAHGVKGDGFALEFGSGKFHVPVTPETKELVFEVDIVRFHVARFRTKVRGIGRALADGKLVAEPLEIEVFIQHPRG